MDLVEWNPFREMSRDMANLFERTPFRFFGDMSSPRVDVYQTDTDVIVKAEIPGASKEDLNVYVEENAIRLSGQFRKSNEFKEENIYRTERYYGSFSRTISLPTKIKSDQARAEYQDGILSITAPKLEPTKTKGRRLEIH